MKQQINLLLILTLVSTCECYDFAFAENRVKSSKSESISATNLTPPESKYSKLYYTCMSSPDASNAVTYALINCKIDELARQDKLLNELYKKVYANATDNESRKNLKLIEAKWIKAKDAMCDSESADAGMGSAASVAQVDCFLRLTADRVLVMKRFDESGQF